MDPYLARLNTLLGERDPLEVLRETPPRLEATVLDPDFAVDRPWRPGGWTGREIVAHLADQEIGFGFRVRQVVAARVLDPGEATAPHSVQPYDVQPFDVQPFDQDAWARDYARMDPALAASAFSALRAWNLAWLARLELLDWLAPYRHPERGTEETVDEAVRFLAGHDLNHLAQLGELLTG